MAGKERSGRPGAPRDEVLAGVQQLRAIYAEGQEVLRLLAKPAKPGQTKMSRMDKEAVRRGMNRDYLWKSMMLADPRTGLSPEELDQLCQWTKEHRRIVGRAFVSKLLSVPKKSRMPFAKKVLEQGLSLSEIDTELTRRFGRRRQGGRHPRMLGSRRAILVGLDGKCVSWHRLYELLNTPPISGSPRRVHLADLPEGVQEGIEAVDRAVRKLKKAVEQHLSPVQDASRKAAKSHR